MASKKETRQQKILALLATKPYLSIKALSEQLSLSEMTIRRDVAEIARTHKVSVINGVLLGGQDAQPENYDISAAQEKYHAEKERIGKFAASLIQPDDVVALDIGTTTERIARNIDTAVSEEIIVVCYTLNALNAARANGVQKMVFSGGWFHQETELFESEYSLEILQQYRINKAFISAAGVSPTLGVTCVHRYETPLKNAVMAAAQEKYLVFDSSKFGVVKPAYFADITDFDCVITDTGIPQEAVEYFEKNKIKVIQV